MRRVISKKSYNLFSKRFTEKALIQRKEDG